MFVKHYATNICFPKYGQICTVLLFHKKMWTLLKSLTGNLLIIPYQLTKFQTPSSNLIWLKCPLQRAITQENLDRIFSKVNQVISSSYPNSRPSFKPLAQIVFLDILLTNLKCPNIQSITPKIFDRISSIFNQVINLSLPIRLNKFQAPSSNSFRDILMTSLKCPNLQRAVTPEKFDWIF